LPAEVDGPIPPQLHGVTYAVENGTTIVKIKVIPDGDELIVDASTGRLIESRPSRPSAPPAMGKFAAPVRPHDVSHDCNFRRISGGISADWSGSSRALAIDCRDTPDCYFHSATRELKPVTNRSFRPAPNHGNVEHILKSRRTAVVTTGRHSRKAKTRSTFPP
jgi:hypothetical protein